MYYDGGCPLCRAEIAGYQRSAGAAALRWVDADGCAPDDLGPGLSRGDALARMHVRRADGTLLQGAAAFAEVWAALPRWAWLARAVRLPGALALLELGYRGFLRVRPLWRTAPVRGAAGAPGGAPASLSPAAPALEPCPAPPAPRAAPFPRALWRELRTDHAGETGAVFIYRGVLAASRDPALREFARRHLAAEERHLALIEAVVPPRWRSRLLPGWRASGWLIGALPALFGPRAVYATVQAVETFVDRHYAEQVAWIDRHLRGGAAPAADGPDDAPAPDGDRGALLALRRLLEQCRQDEVAHRDDAGSRLASAPGGGLAAWCALVGSGSAAAVAVCRRI